MPEDKNSISRIWLLAVVLLIFSGVAYRVITSRLELIVTTPIKLPVQLNDFPMHVGNWSGKDVPIPENVLRVAANDDSMNRFYINELSNRWVNIYIAYSARPRTMLGHRPRVCYVGGGWIHDSTEESSFISSSGKHVPCLIHHFHMPEPSNDQIVVLNYYILNGKIITDDHGFSGVGIRTPNIAGNPARYVAQIQISSVLENSTLTAAKDMTDLILGYFPDEDGNVKVAERNNR
ncbi:MAG: EpsI family protein [Sedimentisphaerales bacterium]|nr:EpsI family protein [Sedimentisphaerales bacterium]